MHNEKNCTIHTSRLFQSTRQKREDSSISKDANEINITFCEDDTLEKLELDLSILKKNSFLYFFKKKFSTMIVSIISVLAIMFALISVSIYEDLLKKVLFEFPFNWNIQDSISLALVVIFVFGLVLMPSLLDGEGSEFKNTLLTWFNKDIKKYKRLKLAFSMFDKTTVMNLYNFDLAQNNHWIWNILVKMLLSRFQNINFYVRNDQIESTEKKIKLCGTKNNIEINTIDIVKEKRIDKEFDINILLSNKEQSLLSFMRLCSSFIIPDDTNKNIISLELFDYCGRNFFDEDKKTNDYFVSEFQSFINRAFEDFEFIRQEKSFQIYFTNNVKCKNLEDEYKRLAYYLRNHIEDCLSSFHNPLSLLLLYYYVKDIVLDERRIIAIIERFISSIMEKQQYEMIDDYWFDLAGKMFDSSLIEEFATSNTSFYRKISIESMNQLIFLFERNGHYEQALLIVKYLYEINPTKYSINMCSLYERMGKFEKSYSSLPDSLKIEKKGKPNDIEVRYFQRKAWIIVSQRKEDLREEGINSLNCLEELIFGHYEDNKPLDLWHYYNIKANYAEWAEDYDEAINNYKKCLAIPALGAFEYGATFVNMAITYRLKYIENEMQDIETINKAIEIGEIGVLLKESVGDRDEMPVVLHNQALHMLYKTLNISNDKIACKKIEKITSEAISILDKTNSIKRMGMLLIESYISKNLLKKDCQEIMIRLEKHLPYIDTHELLQLKEVYQEFRKLKQINEINFL